MILTAGRSDSWIETELQNRFRLDLSFGFGILTADDGLAGFSDWKRKNDADDKERQAGELSKGLGYGFKRL